VKMKEAADLCLLDITVASGLWGRNWHGRRADATEKVSEPRWWGISTEACPTPIPR